MANSEVEFRENSMTVEEYLMLRQRVGWRELSQEQAQKALDNSLYVLSAWLDGELVGMSRLVGDGAVICYIQDLIVVPGLQRGGIGTKLVQRLIEVTKSMGFPGTRMMLDLMCAKGREEFYIKNGFIARPTSGLGPGMIQYLDIEEEAEQ